MSRAFRIAGGVAASLLLMLVAPVASLDFVANGAKACFRKRRLLGAKPCPTEPADLAELAPWTKRPALRVADEARGREAIEAYLAAAVGDPSREARRVAFASLATVDRGRREREQIAFRFDELGESLVATPPGPWALVVGDRDAVRSESQWSGWPTTTFALRTEVIELGLDAAAKLAVSYGAAASGQADLELLLSTLAAINGNAQESTPRLSALEKRLADDRNANFSRDYGAVRVALEAMAAGPAPEPAVEGSGGSLDHQPQLLTERHRRKRRACKKAEGDQKAVACAELQQHAERLRGWASVAGRSGYRHEMAALAAPDLNDERGAGLLNKVFSDAGGPPCGDPDAVDFWSRIDVDEPVLFSSDWQGAIDLLPEGANRARACLWLHRARAATLEGRVASQALGEAAKSGGWDAATLARRVALSAFVVTGTASPASLHHQGSRRDPAVRRAARYRAVLHPASVVSTSAFESLVAYDALLEDSEGDREVWRDAFLAPHQLSLSLHHYAWLRFRLASQGGEVEVAHRWHATYRALITRLMDARVGAALRAIRL